MKTRRLLLAAGFLAGSTASANITIDTSFVGDAGSANDSTGFGGVSHNYRVGTHEVTNSQYAAFLNAKAGSADPNGLYNANMNSSFRGSITNNGGGSFSF